MLKINLIKKQRWIRLAGLLGALVVSGKILAQDLAPYRMTVWVPGTNFQTLLPFSGSKFNKTGLEHFSTFRKGSESYHRALCLAQQDPAQFPTDGFYLFRWPGRLRHKVRLAAGERLFEDLLTEIKQIQATTGRGVHLTILTHSYGGSVALTLAQQNAKAGYPLLVDRLILLAYPVQARLSGVITDQAFGRVCAFYSSSDWLQVLAPQRWSIGAGRRFSACSKLVHVQTSWQNGGGLGHNDFKSIKFLQYLPKMLTDLELNWLADASLKI